MQEFVKSLLNYYAAFTETRFSSRSTLNYRWTNDPNLTLDISFFPEFRALWLDKLSNNDASPVDILPQQYKIDISQDKFAQRLRINLQENFNPDFLCGLIAKEKEKWQEIEEGDNGNQPDEPREIPNDRQIYLDCIRAFNLELRKSIDKIVRDLQKEKLHELERTYRIDSFPPTSFNLRSFTQNIYNSLQQLGQDSEDEGDYYEKLKDYFDEAQFDLTLYDLYYLLNNYAVNEAYGTAYLFFDSLRLEKGLKNTNGATEYPLFFIEVNFDSNTPDIIRLSVPRDIVLLNTPAINSFEFDRVLSMPRASSFKESIHRLKQLDSFFITEYKIPQRDLTADEDFFFFPGPEETLPLLKFRLGFQVVKNEDKRLLDYSELMTRVEKGMHSKVGDFVDVYVNKNVTSTVDETENSFKERYPSNSPRHYLTDNPLPLNTAQKKILIALANPKNKVITVGGPPGTGKSHAIAAITYWANQNNKSVVITSHKKEALDVVDRMLTDKFRNLHPYAKPSIIRLTKSYAYNKVDSLNEIDNSLSLPAIDAATARVSEFRPEVIESDKEKIKENLDFRLAQIIEKIKNYPEKANTLLRYLTLEEELIEKKLITESDVEKISTPESLSGEFESLKEFIDTFSADKFRNVSLKNLTKLYQKKQNIPQLLESCETINRISLAEDDFSKIDIRSLTNFNHFKDAIDMLLPVFDDGRLLSQLTVTELAVEKSDLQNAVNTFKELKEIEGRLDSLLGLKPKLPLPNKKYTLEEKTFKADYPEFAQYWQKSGLKLKKINKQVADEIEKIRSYQQDCCYTDEFIYSLSGQTRDFSKLESYLKEISSLKYKNIFDAIALLSGKDESELTLKDLTVCIEKIDSIVKYSKLIQSIRAFQEKTEMEGMSYEEIFSFLDKFTNVLDSINHQNINALNKIENTYAHLLNIIGIDFNNLESLFKIKTLLDEDQKLFKLIELHAKLSTQDVFLPDIRQQIDEYHRLNQRLAEYNNDNRLKNLNNYRTDVERIKVQISKGKRLTPKHAQILLSNFACIIAEPEAIFKYFPMEEDLIDILVFDEASQVSIAHSISLILRAKQVVVFGDKYQYGAVGAVNVSKKYSGSYFKNIIDSYRKEFDTHVTPDIYNKLMKEETEEILEEEQVIPEVIEPDLNNIEWIKTFSIRNSTLNFCEAISNYHTSLTEHFRSFKEIIDYSNEFFYKKAQIPLIINRLRTKPIKEVLRFIKVETQGSSGRNVNVDEIEAIRKDIEELVNNGFNGTTGIITSFREQQQRAEEYLRKKLSNYHKLKQDQKLTIWFVGDVQGEERDIVYYSLVRDKKLNNADLRTIYPVPGGTADDIKSLKMQRLNVGFSRAKDTMVFVHSMDIEDYSDSRLGDALKFYWQIFQETKKKDYFIQDKAVFESPKEKELYNLCIQTDFYRENRNNLRIIPQFDIGKYISQEYQKYIPRYRVDFLMTLSDSGKEKSLILEYDGLEYHTKDPHTVKSLEDFRGEYLEYDIKRQLELESYGYHFLRINKFSLLPKEHGQTKVDVLNDLLINAFSV